MSVRINHRTWTMGVILAGLLGRSWLAMAQSPILMSSARASREDSLSISASDTPTSTLRLLPLFGERSKTAQQIDFEISFLTDCDRQFATRTEASKFFSTRGWEYLGESQLDTAVYRFNLAWLLDNNNADAYWGLGVVSYQRDHLPEAVRLLNKGAILADSDATLLTDLATLELQLFRTNKSAQTLADAQAHLQRAILARPDHASAYQKMSLVYFQQGDYAAAWANLHKCRALDLTQLDFTYLNELIAKMPDPQGVFR